MFHLRGEGIGELILPLTFIIWWLHPQGVYSLALNCPLTCCQTRFTASESPLVGAVWLAMPGKADAQRICWHINSICYVWFFFLTPGCYAIVFDSRTVFIRRHIYYIFKWHFGYIRLHKYINKVNLIFFTFINVAIRKLKLQSGLPSSLGHAHLLSLEFSVFVLFYLFIFLRSAENMSLLIICCNFGQSFRF